MSYTLIKLLKNNVKKLNQYGSSKKQESSKKTPVSALLTMPKPLTVWITINCGKFFYFYFFFCFFFFNFILFNFTILYWFCHISKWICHRYTCVPHPKPSSLLPPHTTPLGHPGVPAPSIQYHASNLDWRLISYMILYVFQCHSPKSSHPLPTLSHRVQKTVLYISVSFAVSYTGLLLPSF